MPFGNGTGPLGQGPGTGRGLGRGRGRMGGSRAAGPRGNCVCPRCGTRIAHKPGVPCSSIDCPECGTRMIRE